MLECEFDKYLNIKFIQSVVNDCKFIKKLDFFSSIILKEDFIQSMSEFTDIYIKSNLLDEDKLQNFLSLISYIKENCNLPKEDYFSYLNEMIISVNKSDSSNAIEYLLENFRVRFYGHISYNKKYEYELVKKNKETIKKSNSKDYFALMLLLELSDEDFNISLSEVILDEYFLLSINQIIYEVPNIVENKLFLKRFRIILTENIKQVKLLEEKRFRKIMYNESKYYYKHLKEE